jgi:hypothetical protein
MEQRFSLEMVSEGEGWLRKAAQEDFKQLEVLPSYGSTPRRARLGCIRHAGPGILLRTKFERVNGRIRRTR